MKRHLLALLLPLAGLMLTPGPVHADNPDDLLVVANKSVSVDSISVAEARLIFLKKRATWRGGGKVLAVHAKWGTSLRKTFQRRALNMTADDERTYWQKEKIRKGLGEPPTAADLLRVVFHVKRAVSYVFRHQYKKGAAKVLLVLPGDQ